MTLLIICDDPNTLPWVEALTALEHNLDIQVWPNVADKNNVKFALCWNQPPGSLQEYPNLKCICSMGAGVDHFFNDPSVPREIPLVRLIDPSLAQSMYEYILAMVLYYVRDLDKYETQKLHASWRPHVPAKITETKIGVMGLGKLGVYSAEKLVNLGFRVSGWSRTQKSLEQIECYSENQLDLFLSHLDILVCLLPLTPQTTGVLNSELFAKLPPGAKLINVARGQHLVETDLLKALASGQLSAASLDVFSQEPLPADHPFWHEARVFISPHSSSLTDPVSVAPQIVDNYQRALAGESLQNRVDWQRGY